MGMHGLPLATGANDISSGFAALGGEQILRRIVSRSLRG